jgi:hypothetical protein
MRQCASRKPGEPIPFHGACWWPPREKGPGPLVVGTVEEVRSGPTRYQEAARQP